MNVRLCNLFQNIKGCFEIRLVEFMLFKPALWHVVTPLLNDGVKPC